MSLSDLSIRRPIICLVASILILLVGVLRFGLLPVREYPNVDVPTISVSTTYPGASAEVVETKITEPLEKEISSVEGIQRIRSSSSEQSSSITVEFSLSRDIDEAANDIRDRASRVRLPNDVNEVRVTKTDPESSPVFTISFNSEKHSRLEISEMLERLVEQRIQSVPGVASTKIDGPRYAMRLWLDSDRLAAYGLTVGDVERALNTQNVEVPSGRIESVSREFPVRLLGNLAETADFENLVLATRGNSQVKLKDVGRVELGREEYRSETWFNGNLSVGFQVTRQTQANLLELTRGVRALLPQIRADLPSDINIVVSKDDSVYVERCVNELYKTFYEAAILVMLTIFLFLRDWRATLIPLFSIPVSIVGSIAVIASLGFSINVLTLLAFVLSIGLVVDDAIVMLENIYRKVEEGESVIQAAIFGARQVTFAIISTTLTLVAVFMPVAFQSGQTGRLFYEFGISLAVSVLVSAFVALTLTPMLSSRMLQPHGGHGGRGWFYRKTEGFFKKLNTAYTTALEWAMSWRWAVLLSMVVFCGTGGYLYSKLQRELVPAEDRGIITANAIPPVGSTPEYLQSYILDMARIIGEIPEMDRYFVRTTEGTSAYVTGTLRLWEDRTRTTQQVITELRRKFAASITGTQATVAPARAFGSNASGGGRSNAVQLVLQGSEYSQLQTSGAALLKSMRDSGLFGPSRIDPSFTKPQLDVTIDRAKAADLHVSVSEIAATMETMLGSRQVTEFQRGNQQYYVILQVEDQKRVTPSDLARLYARSTTGHLVQLSNLVTLTENAVPQSYPHFNRLRSLTVSGQLAEGVTIGDAVSFLEREVHVALPPGYSYAWDGESRSFVESASDTSVLFALALVFTFLILAAQFESWIHPMTIFVGVALALAGGVIVLYCTRFWGMAMTDNLFSRFGLIMLIGLVAKNGILIVEFANQLQVKEGLDGARAARKAAALRFRPILMTSIATILGASPIAFGGGAGAETRNPLGIVVVGGLALSTVLTLFVVPIVYVLMDRLCLKLTGHSSAAGLRRAKEIMQESERIARGQESGEPAMAK
jgi:multidrug efflux pump